MKKLFITIFCLSIALTGCGQKTTYQQLVNEVKPLTSKDAIEVTYGSIINDPESDIVETEYEINYTFNLKDDLFNANIDGIDMYFIDDLIYMNLFGTWFQDTYIVENYGDVQNAYKLKNLLLDLPNGNQKLDSNPTGVSTIDQVLNGKTLNELVVSTGDNTYTITGLESILKITTGDTMRIDYTSEETGPVYYEFSTGTSITLPTEAETAVDLGEAGGISSLIDTEN